MLIGCSIPIASNGMDYVCELVYLVWEVIAGGLIMCCNQISGIIGVLISNALVEYYPNKKYLTNVIGIILWFISIISIALIKEKLGSSEKEEKKNKTQGTTQLLLTQ